MGECGTKIYYKPFPRNRVCATIDRNGTSINANGIITPLPEYLLVNFQTSGEDCDTQVIVPEYCLEAMFTGIDYFSKRFNNAYNSLEKRESLYSWNDAQNSVIRYLNAFSLQTLGNIMDQKIEW